jgi:hypothetical protein
MKLLYLNNDFYKNFDNAKYRSYLSQHSLNVTVQFIS